MKRKFIKRNKNKLNKLLRTAKLNGMNLPTVIELKKSLQEVKVYARMKSRYGEVLRWDLVDPEDEISFRGEGIVSVPLYTPEPHNKFLNMYIWKNVKDK